YYPAKDVDLLKAILETEVAAEITKEKQTLSKTFESVRPQADGLPRKVEVRLVRRGGIEKDGKKGGGGGSDVEVQGPIQGTVQRGGVVIAEMDHFVYLGLLLALGCLIALPALLRRRAS